MVQLEHERDGGGATSTSSIALEQRRPVKMHTVVLTSSSGEEHELTGGRARTPRIGTSAACSLAVRRHEIPVQSSGLLLTTTLSNPTADRKSTRLNSSH